METIRTYTNTKCELEIAKTRLSLLLDEKEELYAKYFPITQQLKEDIVTGGKKDNDKMAMYVHELNKVDSETGRSLAQEIEYQRAAVDRLVSYIKIMDETLSKMQGIEYSLYYEIVISGVNTSRAVSNVAELYGIDDSTIWKYHYGKIKKEVEKIKMSSECPVKRVV